MMILDMQSLCRHDESEDRKEATFVAVGGGTFDDALFYDEFWLELKSSAKVLIRIAPSI